MDYHYIKKVMRIFILIVGKYFPTIKGKRELYSNFPEKLLILGKAQIELDIIYILTIYGINSIK